MSDKPKTIAITLIKFLVPVVIIGYLLWRMPASDWAKLSERSIAYPVLFAALGVALAAIVLSFVRWWLLVRSQGIPLSLMEAMRLSSICFLLSFVSAGSVGGDVFKAVFLARRSPGKRIAAVASVLVDRGAGLYGLLLLVSMGLLIRKSTDPFEFNGVGLDDIKWMVGVLLGVGTAVLVMLVFGGKIVDRLITRLSEISVIGPVVEKIGPPLRTFHDHPWTFALSLVMSVGVQGLLVVSMFLIATSMYGAPPTLAEHFVIVPIGMLASALPLTPAGIGVLEATIETLYHLVPAQPTDASGTLVALVFELVKLVLAIIGTIFYWTAGKDVQESLEYAEEHGEEFEHDVLAKNTP
ncbi:YbhN family protein [Rhodopirellula sp. SWK7]|uniref:lysylphosphatidylglycerol synthase transmembrane domain-containing protein n=1 Tax=Rhodopirellula sp. SWK7 TaxID=595460 RepID=UPI0002BFE040|nr:lysylphosphatidylglycerol synthase transmembrane domain-containing protein [Rhodopirellula sp. SWK7]EMI46695.1 putative membrane protein [Rhodopirellula sp. SWK7]